MGERLGGGGFYYAAKVKGNDVQEPLFTVWTRKLGAWGMGDGEWGMVTVNGCGVVSLYWQWLLQGSGIQQRPPSVMAWLRL